MLKTTFKKEESKQFIFRDYKNFDNTNFQMDLESKLNSCPKKYGIFEETFENVLNAHAPNKTNFCVVIRNLTLTKIFGKPL